MSSSPGSFKRPLSGPAAPSGVPTKNDQPAYGMYLRDPQAGIAHASGLLVLTLTGRQIGAMTRFDNSVMGRFGLPRTLPD